MIHYQLRCEQDHEFDGWFNDSAGFETQAKRGLIECPECGGTKVARALMAPAVATRTALVPAPKQLPVAIQQVLPPAARPPASLSPASQSPLGGLPELTGPPMPARLVALLQRMRAEVERNCDYVGPSFAEEARKIHRGEARERGIYGETTPDEAESLAEEGIDIHSIPWVPPADG
jgi:hypothetical protein